MKAPSLNLRGVSDFALKHGEKVVAAIIGLGSLALLWSGIDAIRSLAVTDAQSPRAVEQAAAQAREHIDREPKPPDELLPPRTPLADAIDPYRLPLVPWKSGSAPWLTIVDPPAVALINRPLFDEAAKRGRPEVFPVEDLRAVAGLAVLPIVEQAVGPGGPRRPATAPDARPRPPEAADAPPGPGPGRGRPRGGDPLGGGPGTPLDLPPGMGPGVGEGGGMPGEAGRLVPYVIVTGLIPAAKQYVEYGRQFGGASYRDPRRDAPLWCDYEIDRATVGPDGKETWSRIDLVALARQRAKEWGEAGGDPGIPQPFLLGTTEDARSRQTTPIGFCATLPRRLDGTWELGDLHPWVVDRIVKELEEAEIQREAGTQESPEFGPGGPGGRDPGFANPLDMPPEQTGPEVVRDEGPEYRMFRFVDTSVEAGRTYRYRVRLKVWNPNFDRNPERMRPHVADPTFALEPKLSSPDSAASPGVKVPDKARILVAPLRRDDIKELRFRPGSSTLEVLVLGPSDATQTLALRGLIADPGAIVDVDEKLNAKNQRDRARGERITTGAMLLDARGRLEDRRDGPAEKEKPPGAIPEPLDVLCLRPDGTFEVASAAESERAIADHADTLPPRSPRADATVPAVGEPRLDMPVDPLARPRPGA